jgi:catechol 2,3-dioxygenase-like lactoylglutathione lyase family enzyme
MKHHTNVFYLSFAVFTVVLATSLADDNTNAKPQGMSIRLELFVTDMEKSIDFYTTVLGFERLKGEPTYVPVRSGSVVIGLGPAATLPKQHHFNPEVQNGRRGLGTEIVLEVDDIQAFFEKVKASGYKKVSSPLRKQTWGATDFRLVDPDGYYLRITSR